MHFITKKHLSRRAVLRGVGATIGLPLLDAMIPASTVWAQTAAVPKMHMAFLYFPHGAIMDQWTPAGTGTDFKLSRILTPLADYQKADDRGQQSRQPPRGKRGRACHRARHLVVLRASKESQDPYGGVTIDQMAALENWPGHTAPVP
ncbi:MAG: DUF1552 domain-containing protein [Steroidobacteraceae bacterium]